MKSALFAATAAIFLIGAAPAADRTAPKNDPAKRAGCATCRETKPLVDPAELADFDAESRPAYAAAKKYPETIDKIHCYCGCEESPNLHHKSLLTCYTSLHATGCEVCRGEAEMAAKMKGEGSSDGEVKSVVEMFYKPENK
ncbi:MAG: PCYCGC motif-containing (lipo)protein [Thermoanaerobaculia bacterium]